jgi:hypothetical protein
MPARVCVLENAPRPSSVRLPVVADAILESFSISFFCLEIQFKMDQIASPQPSHARSSSKDVVVVSEIPFSPSSPLDEKFTPNPKHASTQSWQSTDSYASTSSTNTLTPFLEKDLEKQQDPLPRKRYSRVLRHARHTFGNVYRRLFSVVFIFNMIGLGVVFGRYHDRLSSPSLLSHCATAASANIMVALLVRQDYVVNILFRMTWFIPLSAPLRLRRILAKVYEYGGVHSGAACASVIWFILLTGFLTNNFAKHLYNLRDPAIMTFTYILLALLFSLCVTAYPRFRFSSHNTFENVHRWAGWFSLGLFWIELVLFARTQSTPSTLGITLIKLPAFWFLLVSSLHAIYPWLRFHKMPVEAEKLSNHAIRLHFEEKIPLFVGIRISDAPLREWHSFACIPARNSEQGGSVLISDAGDWTKKTIASPNPYYYVKGVPVTGVMCMARIFRKIICVTTGSGIGPVLAVIQDIPKSKIVCRVLWSTPSPLVTYGQGIVDAVTSVDSEAVIIDTRKERRPDLLRRAYELYKQGQAEAVFVISNPKLTRKVVYGLESRGVPAFGPIWDS